MNDSDCNGRKELEMTKRRLAEITAFILVFSSFLAVPKVFAEMPLAYPWFTYGGLGYDAYADDDRGLMFTGYIESGIDWVKIPIFNENGPIFNTYLGLNWGVSTASDRWWDNQISPRFGFKFKFPLTAKPGLCSGELNIGVYGEYISYFQDDNRPFANEARVVAGATWYFGGDLKNVGK